LVAEFGWLLFVSGEAGEKKDTICELLNEAINAGIGYRVTIHH
jgi:hypothetical protein